MCSYDSSFRTFSRIHGCSTSVVDTVETWITCGGETSLSAKEDFTEVRVEVAFPPITEEVSAGVTSSCGIREPSTAGKEAEASTRGGGET